MAYLFRAADFVAFDLEMDRLLEWGGSPESVSSHAPRILCGCTVSKNAISSDIRMWRSASKGAPMSSAEVGALVDYLWLQYTAGKVLVTWGGTASDWRLLALECGDPLRAQQCKLMALTAVDIPFMSLCTTGTMMSLDAAARGMGLGGKAPSHDIPSKWARGEHDAVLAHVRWDAWTTAQLYEQTVQHKDGPQLHWITQKGKKRVWAALTTSHLGQFGFLRMLSVTECLRLPHPTPVFSSSFTREDMVQWVYA